MFDKFPAQTWLVRLTCGYYGCVHEWKKPTRETLAPLKRAHEIGLESGDIEFSIFCMNVYLWKQFGVLPLPELEREILETVTLMDLHGQLSNRTMIASVWQGALNLMGRASGDVCTLSGDAMDERDLSRWKGAKEGFFVWACHIKMVLCYLFGRYNEASECAEHCQELIRHPFGTPGVCAVVFFESLTYLALQRSSPKRSRMKVIKRGLRKMENWAHHSPNNFLAMQCLLEAELAALKGAEGSARAKYLCAISLSKDMGALQLIAMSYERLGKFLLERGHQVDALQYLDEALQYYEAYGAVAKVHHLRNQLLEPRFSSSLFSKPT
jgi:tetratricopeptide (TPR) repeat protein